MEDSFNLDRFVAAQAPIFDQVRRELTAGAKGSHWMWFIFPQLAGLGLSATSRHFAIVSIAEARAYLQHPVLGPRLLECTALVNGVNDRSANNIFGAPDDMKFRSCMTLFAQVAEMDNVFAHALHRFFDGRADPATLSRLT